MDINLKNFNLAQCIHGIMVWPTNDSVIGKCLPLYGEWSEGENIIMSKYINEGDTVNVVIDSSYQKGQPHHRFHGLTGKVTGNQGKAYVVSTRVGNIFKDLIVRPEHLRKAK